MTSLKWVLLLTLGLTACAAPKPTVTALAPPAAAPTLTPAPTVAPTVIPQRTQAPASTVPLPTLTPQPQPHPLSERGPYDVGFQTFTLHDDSRDGRRVGIQLWYPAVRPPEATYSAPSRDGDPDLRGAPYPLILGSAKVGDIFASHLVSHGFAWAGVDIDPGMVPWGEWLIDYPLDIVFALDQIAATPPDGLAGVINADQAGAMGYSFDGYNSLALSGARVDPQFYLAQCARAPTVEPSLPTWGAAGMVGYSLTEYYCRMAAKWDELVAHAGKKLTTSPDGLWQPMTDKRIRAVIPMAPEGAWLFGERGLAAADRPTMIIGATNDDLNFYGLEAVYIYEHLGTPDRVMISFIGKDHFMVFDAEPVAWMKHFATAFFGYHLQARKHYAQYFSQDFVAQQDGLAWGVYRGS
jgi:predicted dienelactone hydrolase